MVLSRLVVTINLVVQKKKVVFEIVCQTVQNVMGCISIIVLAYRFVVLGSFAHKPYHRIANGRVVRNKMKQNHTNRAKSACVQNRLFTFAVQTICFDDKLHASSKVEKSKCQMNCESVVGNQSA